MIIHSSKSLKNDKLILSNSKEKQSVIKKIDTEEVKLKKKKNNKKPNPAPAPAVEETPVVAEEEEKIDLSEWLKDDIED